MAKRLGVDHQQLQQFVSSSTWDYSKVWERLARWAAAHISPEAYAIDDVGFPKDGCDSPGVARMYCGALGNVLSGGQLDVAQGFPGPLRPDESGTLVSRGEHRMGLAAP
ncbi:transposase [Streptomyces atratus]|uniref:transposase n=1 Tax=Streptomyces atratus TaxID=1893 RepID=UPI0036550DE7